MTRTCPHAGLVFSSITVHHASNDITSQGNAKKRPKKCAWWFGRRLNMVLDRLPEEDTKA